MIDSISGICEIFSDLFIPYLLMKKYFVKRLPYHLFKHLI